MRKTGYSSQMKRALLLYSFVLLITNVAFAQNECTLRVDTVYRTSEGLFNQDGSWKRNKESLNKYSTTIGVLTKKENGVPFFNCLYSQGLYQLWERLTEWEGDIPFPAVFRVYNYGTKPVEMYSGKWCCKKAVCNPSVIQPGGYGIISVKDFDISHAKTPYGKVLHFNTSMGPFNIHTSGPKVLQSYETYPDKLQFSAKGGEFIIQVKAYTLLSASNVNWLYYSVSTNNDGVKLHKEIRISCSENKSNAIRESRIVFNTPNGKISIPIIQEGNTR